MAFFSFLLGIIVGSFLNVIIFRTKHERSILGRSLCQNCKKKIIWKDNIPIISFFLLGKKCRNCKSKISWQYPLVEFGTGVLFIVAYLRLFYGNEPFTSSILLELIRNFIFLSILVVIFVMDLRWYIILDIITIPAIIFSFFINIFLGIHWSVLMLGGIIGGGFFLAQYILSSGKWIGGGDIRLGSLMGVMLGWKVLLLALFLAYILGAVIGIMLIIFGKKKFSSKVPFGTFLTFACALTLLFGDTLLNIYMRFIGFA